MKKLLVLIIIILLFIDCKAQDTTFCVTFKYKLGQKLYYAVPGGIDSMIVDVMTLNVSNSKLPKKTYAWWKKRDGDNPGRDYFFAYEHNLYSRREDVKPLE